MKDKIGRTAIVILVISAFLLPCSYLSSAQQFGAGAKLVGTTPYLFTEAKLWIFSVELGAGISSSDSTPTGYENTPIDIGMAAKVYPIEVMNLSPYLGASFQYSTNGLHKQSRTFMGAEFDLPGQGIPLSAFGGGGYAFAMTEGATMTWHLGVRYRFQL